jgi:hypothetical protein
MMKCKVSVYFILPETKGVSLERMDTIFGEVDAVEVGEQEGGLGKGTTISRSSVERHEHVGYKSAVKINEDPEKAL